LAFLRLTVLIAQTHFVITRDIPHKDGLDFFEVNFCFAMPSSVVSQQPIDKLGVESPYDTGETPALLGSTADTTG